MWGERSLGLATALNPFIGYEAAAEVAKEALRSGKTVREVVLEKGILSERGARRAARSGALTEPRPPARSS